MAADGQHHIDALNRAGGRARQCEHLSYARDRFCAMLPPGAEIFVGRHSTVPQEDLKNFSMRSLKKNIRRNQFKVLAYWDGAPCAIATIPAIHDRCVAAHHQSPSRVLLLLLLPPPPISYLPHASDTRPFLQSRRRERHTRQILLCALAPREHGAYRRHDSEPDYDNVAWKRVLRQGIACPV